MIIFFPQAFQEKCVFEYRDYSPRTAFDNLKKCPIFAGKNNKCIKNGLIHLVAEKAYYFTEGGKRNPKRF